MREPEVPKGRGGSTTAIRAGASVEQVLLPGVPDGDGGDGEDGAGAAAARGGAERVSATPRTDAVFRMEGDTFCICIDDALALCRKLEAESAMLVEAQKHALACGNTLIHRNVELFRAMELLARVAHDDDAMEHLGLLHDDVVAFLATPLAP